MSPAVQTNYEINPDRGFPGLLAQPSAPHALDSGILSVPTSATRNPQPGDAVYYDATANAYAVPTSAAHSLAVCGILSYRQDTVADSDSIVRFVDGDEIEVAVLGGFWVTAGSAVEYNQLLTWDQDRLPCGTHWPSQQTMLRWLNTRLCAYRAKALQPTGWRLLASATGGLSNA